MVGPDGLSALDALLVAVWISLHAMWIYTSTASMLELRSSMLAAASSPVTAGESSDAAATEPPSAPATVASQPPVALAAADSSSPAAGDANGEEDGGGDSGGYDWLAYMIALPLSQFLTDEIAYLAGIVGRLDVLLLFFPLPRCNFLAWMLGTEWGTLIKYHRWLGHGTLIAFTLHGVMYMALWAQQGVLAEEMKWGTYYVNNRAGMVSLAGGWALWLTSLGPVRRRLFNQVFYPTHIVGALVFMLFAFMHVPDMAPWVLPGVFLYLLDVVLRNIQPWFNATSVTTAANAQLSADGSLVTLAIPACESVHWVAGDVVFLKVPSVSRWQWHPFTVASSPAASGPSSRSGGGQQALVVHIKRYSRWTKRFLALLAADPSPHALYVSGPHSPPGSGSVADKLLEYDSAVLVAGGIGVATVLPVIREAIARRRRGQPARPRRVSLLFVSRNAEELSLLPPDVVREAARDGKDSWLDVRLFCTAAPATHGAPAAAAATGASDSRGGIEKAPSTQGAGSSRLADFYWPTHAGAQPSPIASTRPRPLSSAYVLGPLTWALAVALSFTGGFAGLLACKAYDAHQDRTVLVREDLAYLGCLQFAALGFGAMFPPAVLMMCVHATQTRRSEGSRRSAVYRLKRPMSAVVAPLYAQPWTGYYDGGGGSGGSGAQATKSFHVSASSASRCLAVAAPSGAAGAGGASGDAFGNRGSGCADPEKGCGYDADGGGYGGEVPAMPSSLMEHGRPDIVKLLRDAAASAAVGAGAGAGGLSDGGNGADPAVGVFVGGPAALVAAVREAAAESNGVWRGRDGRAFLEPLAAEAGRELLEQLLRELPERQPTRFRLEGARLTNLLTGGLLLLAPGDDGDGEHRLIGGVVAFPSHWSIADKLGMSLSGVHEPVPRWRSDVARPANAFLSRLAVGKAFTRWNWTLSPTAELHLSRLPRSGVIVFTIRTYLQPLTEAVRDRPLVASALADALRDLPYDHLQYKSDLQLRLPAVLAFLDEAAAAPHAAASVAL
ncbi:hypothetical protein GPECTOR_2g940 [Gonium pectorale]|uniref:FAD-binding FR-type domain-containing protein n=1 Tax=Gonium pectorale TaxID=33097 RepID=A0A150H2J4_GONPE|nr:hypothetical protein GPECTOR_2g940 [Gonium pectorale]|eukprot:KXZ56058.1 hypothetical protein GPECTOR_2g940 [Gonium pectorale]